MARVSPIQEVPEDTDVGLAVAVPVAGDGQVAFVSQLGPEITVIPGAVAVEIDKPLAVDKHTHLVVAVTIEVARNGQSAGETEATLFLGHELRHGDILAVDGSPNRAGPCACRSTRPG